MEVLYLFGQIEDRGSFSKELLLKGFQENRPTLLCTFFAMNHIRHTVGECKLLLEHGTDDPVDFKLLSRLVRMLDYVEEAARVNYDDLTVLQHLFDDADEDYHANNDLVLIPSSSTTQSALSLAIQIIYGRQDQPLNEICAILFANYIMLHDSVGALIIQPSDATALMKAIYQLRANGYGDDVFTVLRKSITTFGVTENSAPMATPSSQIVVSRRNAESTPTPAETLNVPA